MDFAATRFPEASFDVVWNLESLCHAGDPRAYLRHAFELLRDGGRFACMDFFRGEAGDPAQAEAMCEGWVLGDLQTLGALGAMLGELGFEEVEVLDVTPRVLPSAAAMEAMGRREVVLRKVKTALGAEANPIAERHFRAAVGAAEGLRSGSVTYGYVGARRPPRPPAPPAPRPPGSGGAPVG